MVEEKFKSGLVLATLKLFVLQRHSTLWFACLWIRIHTQQWDNEPNTSIFVKLDYHGLPSKKKHYIFMLEQDVEVGIRGLAEQCQCS